MKTWEMKAEPMTTSQLDRWLSGKVPRRILVAPFGGPLGKAGLDLDGEYFDDEPCGAPGCRGSDFYGPYPDLRKSRDRLVDFHHTTFIDRPQSPAEEAVKGAIMGHVTLDEYAEEDAGFAGLWGKFWANVGEKRRSLLRWLEENNHPLQGSSQPIRGGVIKGKAGHLCQWPIAFHTITTSPQNTYAIVPPLKARLDDPKFAELSVGALRAFLAGDDDLGRDLLPTSAWGEDGAKAGRVLSGINEQDIDELVGMLLGAAEAARRVLARHRKEGTTQ